MIFPSTYLATLLVFILSLACLGIWASTHKLTTKWRFELFYYDVTFGVVAAAVVAAFTFGSMNQAELTFQDSFLLTGYRKMAWAFAGGGVLNLGLILLLGAMAASRMSVAFPVSLGLGLIIGVLRDDSPAPATSPVVIFSGAAVLLAAVVLFALAPVWQERDELLKAQKPFLADPRSPAGKVQRGSKTGIVLALLSGILLSLAEPMLSEALAGESGVGVYGGGLLLSAGVMTSSLFFLPFFLNFPLQGEPLQLRHYFKGAAKNHLFGLLGGALLGTGHLARLAAAAAPPAAQAGPLLVYLLNGSVAALAALVGLVVWRDFQGATNRVHMILLAGLVLFLTGIAMIASGRAAG